MCEICQIWILVKLHKKSARPHICPDLNVWVKSQLFPADPKKWLSTFDTLRRIILFWAIHVTICW